MEDIKRAAEGPRKDKLAISGDSAVSSDAMRTLKNPVGDVLAGTWPEEAQPNSVQGLVDAHVAGGRRSMVGREDVTSKRQRNDDEHEEFLVVLNRLEDDELAVEKRESVLSDVVSVRRMKSKNIGLGKGRRGRQTIKEEFGIRILLVG